METLTYRLGELAEMVGGEVSGDAETPIRGVAGIREARQGEITFLANPKYEGFLVTTGASAIIAPPALECPKPLIRIENPYFAYLKVITLFARPMRDRVPRRVHDAAVVDPGADLGGDVAVGPFCQISERVRIGRGTTIVSGTYIGEDVEIGEDCLIYPNVTVREGTRIGDRVILQPGVVLGADGFGFAKEGSTHHKVPQIGRVIVEDDVEIGANSTVDRATTGETRIRRGSKIDNLVQIAHNVTIGEDCIIAAQAGVSGSTELEKNVTLAGQAGLVGHIRIGEGSMVGAQAGVTKSVPPRIRVSGYPAREHGRARRIYAGTAQLPQLFKRVKEIEKQLNRLEQGAAIDSPAEDHT